MGAKNGRSLHGWAPSEGFHHLPHQLPEVSECLHFLELWILSHNFGVVCVRCDILNVAGFESNVGTDTSNCFSLDW